MSYNPIENNLTVISTKSVALGVVIGICINNAVAGTQPVICLYLTFVAIFHFLEFFSTSTWNPANVEDDSFILKDYQLHSVNALTIVEHLIFKFFGIPQIYYVQILGLLLVVMGQVVRTLSMYTAKQLFNHYIQRTKNEDHILVTNGVYRYFRHPSYFGFFYWFIGLRLMMGNFFVLVFGGYKIWTFFSLRIPFEERYLDEFFGEKYDEYRRSVGTKIPFIK